MLRLVLGSGVRVACGRGRTYDECIEYLDAEIPKNNICGHSCTTVALDNYAYGLSL